MGSGKRCELSCGSQQSPTAKRFWCILRLKITL